MKEAQFDKAYFQRFALVLNGLDNVEARRHVNRLSLSAGVPLIESGTEGYLGQARCMLENRKALIRLHDLACQHALGLALLPLGHPPDLPCPV